MRGLYDVTDGCDDVTDDFEEVIGCCEGSGDGTQGFLFLTFEEGRATRTEEEVAAIRRLNSLVLNVVSKSMEFEAMRSRDRSM